MSVPIPWLDLFIRVVVCSLALLLVTPGCATSRGTEARVSPESEQRAAPDRVFAYEVSTAHASLAAKDQEAQQAPGTIQVTGHAQISVPPDMVRITFAVETEGRSAGEAVAGNAAIMEDVVSALRRSPVGGLTIETYGYDLQPVYRRNTSTETRQIEGYRARNNISVKVKDVSAAGSLIDVAVEAGANRVASLSFQISDPGPARFQALRDAVAMAREEARTIADAMGLPLGPALEVQGGSNIPRRQELARARLEFQSTASTPIEAGLQTVSASVTIKYGLGGQDH